MSSKYEKYVGITFNFLKITNCIKGKNREYIFIYDCQNCGKKNKRCSSYYVLKYNVKSCGCDHSHFIGNKSKRWTGYKDINGKWFSQIKGRANKKQREFNITIKDVWKKYIKQNKKCLLTGVDIDFGIFCNKIENRYIATASLDRIDSSKGYNIKNIQLVHKDINYIKSYHSNKDIINWAIKINNKKFIANSPFILKRKYNFLGYGNLSLDFISTYKRNTPHFNLDIKFLWDLFEKQNCQCAITGIILVHKHIKSKIEQTASIDRIDPKKQYTEDNVQWVHKDINMMKQDYDQNVFLDWMNKIYLHNKDKICQV